VGGRRLVKRSRRLPEPVVAAQRRPQRLNRRRMERPAVTVGEPDKPTAAQMSHQRIDSISRMPVIPAPVVVPIPVSLAYLYPNAAEPDIGALRDGHRFVDNDQGTGKCRHGEEWNNTEGKNSFHHGTLLGLGRSSSPSMQDARMVLSSLYRNDQR
jgi:hypothetical protein